MSVAFETHDHGQCSKTALSFAQECCKARKLRLTSVRARVLEILLEAHRAMGAYEVLDRLAEEKLGSQPPVAYRALDFLVRHGFAHKIESLNAFVACVQARPGHVPVFLICENCSLVAEARSGTARMGLGEAADELGFAINHTAIEARGICRACQGTVL